MPAAAAPSPCCASARSRSPGRGYRLGHGAGQNRRRNVQAHSRPAVRSGRGGGGIHRPDPHRGVLHPGQTGARGYRYQQLRRQYHPVHGLGGLGLQALLWVSDGPPGCYDDFSTTPTACWPLAPTCREQHPVIYWRLKEALEKRRRFPIVVVDPRVTMFAQFADIHLPITPGHRPGTAQQPLPTSSSTRGSTDEEYIRAPTATDSEEPAPKLVKRLRPDGPPPGSPASMRTPSAQVARLYGEGRRRR